MLKFTISFIPKAIFFANHYSKFFIYFLAQIIIEFIFRPYLVSATEIVDNIVVFANENKRKDELSKLPF